MCLGGGLEAGQGFPPQFFSSSVPLRNVKPVLFMSDPEMATAFTDVF